MNSKSNGGYISRIDSRLRIVQWLQRGGMVVEKGKKVQVALPNAEYREETSLLVVEKKAWQEKREVETIHAIKDPKIKRYKDVKIPRSQRFTGTSKGQDQGDRVFEASKRDREHKVEDWKGVEKENQSRFMK